MSQDLNFKNKQKRPFGVIETLFSSSKSLVKILRLFELKSVTMTPKRRPILLLPFTFFLFQAVYADQNFTEFDGFHIEVGSVLIRN